MAKKPAQKHPAVFRYEELEKRILFSGDIAPGVEQTDVVEHVIAVDETEKPTTETEAVPENTAQTEEEQKWELVLVNENVADHEQLIQDLQGRDGNRIFEVVVLDSDRNGIEQVSQILAERSEISAIHVITHGSDGRINLGNSWLNSDNLPQHADEIANWGKALVDEGDIIFYGCNIGGTGGSSFLSSIAELTNADIAASDDITGHESLGGDWEMEYQNGLIDTQIAINDSTQSTWRNALASPSDIETKATAEGGLSINTDGGNDAYLIADDGGAIIGGLTELTAEVRFSMDAFPGSSSFFSYATAGDDNVFKFNIRDDGDLSLSINSVKINSSAMDYRLLADGQQHTLSVTWNSTGGLWEMFVDGTSTDSGSGLESGQTLAGGSALVMGNDQNSVDGGYDPAGEVAATLYETRIFSDIRSDTEIAANYNATLPYNESGLVANWRFDNLSSAGVVTDLVSGNNLTV